MPTVSYDVMLKRCCEELIDNPKYPTFDASALKKYRKYYKTYKKIKHDHEERIENIYKKWNVGKKYKNEEVPDTDSSSDESDDDLMAEFRRTVDNMAQNLNTLGLKIQNRQN